MDPSKALSPYATRFHSLNHWDSLLLRVLRKVDGTLRIRLPQGGIHEIGRGGEDDVDLYLHDDKLPKRLLLGGSMALAESFIDGAWTTTDLPALLRILGRSQQHLGRFARGTSRFLRGMDRIAHRLRRNNRTNARRNIQEHYDLSNELYETFLDETLTYSSGMFETPSDTLRVSQYRKLDRLIDRLDLTADDHVLEIGSGWGSCAIRMATRTGCRVTSLTLSEEQAREARRRVCEAGLEDRVEIRLQDYRDVTETFDHAISIEMIEAVGHEYLEGYFRTVQSRLKPGGRFALQAITIPDERYADYNRSSDFIRKHIFPGGHLPSPGILTRFAEERAGLRKLDEREFGTDYAETLRRWMFNFFARLDRVKELGFDDRFIRKWQYYFAYCEAGFDTGLIHVRQLLYQA
jgi:cyclopropane-fatty-acyl-phospholipid synthase